MLGDVEQYPGGKVAEQCKPDYEKQIKDQKEQLHKTVRLKSALLDYTGTLNRIHGQLAEMVGELVQEERVIGARIDRLIEQQANNQE